MIRTSAGAGKIRSPKFTDDSPIESSIRIVGWNPIATAMISWGDNNGMSKSTTLRQLLHYS